MSSRKLFFIFILLAAIVGGLGWYLVRDAAPEDGITLIKSDQCEADIVTATTNAQGKICTQHVATMLCPYGKNVTYQATNGCVISQLQTLRWTIGQ